MNWTKPYFGVQHLQCLPKRWQITVADYNTFAEVTVFDLNSDKPFSSAVTKDFFGSFPKLPIEEARAWAEERARALL